MERLVDRMAQAMRDYDPVREPPKARDGYSYSEPALGLLEWMPHASDGTITIKVVGYHPNNPRHHKLPTIVSTLSAYDAHNGHLLGVADGTLLTALRTGAASAIASRIFAKPESSVLGLIGTGAQAVTQLHAVSRYFPLERVLVFDTDDAALASFAGRVAPFGLDVSIEPAPIRDIVEQSDILSTATSIGVNEGPLFDGVETKPWLHINAVGSDFPGKFEVPLDHLRAALVVPDFTDQAVREGECQRLTGDEIGPSLDMVLKDPEAFMKHRASSTVFDSTGWALWDAVALSMVLDDAEKLGLGTPMPIESLPSDPRNPYERLTTGSGKLDANQTTSGESNRPAASAEL